MSIIVQNESYRGSHCHPAVMTLPLQSNQYVGFTGIRRLTYCFLGFYQPSGPLWWTYEREENWDGGGKEQRKRKM